MKSRILQNPEDRSFDFITHEQQLASELTVEKPSGEKRT